jgi:hypothetical protein
MHHTHSNACTDAPTHLHAHTHTPPEKGYTHSHTSACARTHTYLHAVLLERTKHLEGHFEKLPCDLGEGPHIWHHPLRVPQQQVHLYVDAFVSTFQQKRSSVCMYMRVAK